VKTTNGKMKNKTKPAIENHLRDSYISYFFRGINRETDAVGVEGCTSLGELKKKYRNQATVSRTMALKWFSLLPTCLSSTATCRVRLKP